MMINLDTDSFAFSPLTNHGITADDAKPHGGAAAAAAAVAPVSLSPTSSSSDVSSVVSSDDDSDLFGEEVDSSDTSGSSTNSLSGQLETQTGPEPLQDMTSLLQELPFKRGLSKHYNGKSQSFTSLANVASLEDLAKPENPYNKKLKSCKSYGGLYLESQQPSSPRRLMPKKGSRGSCSSLCVRRNSSFLGNGNRPPIAPPSRSNSSSNFASHNSPPSLFALGV